MGRRETGSSRNRSRRDSGSSEEEYSSDDDRSSRKKKGKVKKSSSSSSRRITEEDIAEYLAKKAQKKAMKLKTQTAYGYANDSNPFRDSNLNEKHFVL